MRKIFVMFFSISQIVTLLTSCSNDVVSPSSIIEKQVELPQILDVSSESSINITIMQGSEQKVIVSGYENLVESVDLQVVNGTLKTFLNYDGPSVSNFNLTIELVLPSIRKLGTKDSGNIDVDAFSDLEDLSLEIKGSGNIHFNKDFSVRNTLDALIDGSGSLVLSGTASSLDLDVKGSGSVKAFPLVAQDAIIKVSGSGTVEVQVVNTLEAIISGAGNVMYKGHPSITKQVSGSGRLIDAN